MPKSTAPLTPAMLELIKVTRPGQVMKAGPTRAALMRRGLVWDMEAAVSVAGTLTEAGIQVWRKANPEAPMTDAEAENNSAEEVEELESLGLTDPLEAPLPKTPAQQDAENGDRYARGSMSADVKARDAEGWRVTDAARNELSVNVQAAACPAGDSCSGAAFPGHLEHLPQRVPGEALTQELTGEAEPLSTARPGYRPSVLLRPVRGEVVERATRETFIAVGAIWGRLQGKRVRIVCMDGDVFHQRPLMIVEAGVTELSWVKPTDVSMNMPIPLREGTTVLVDGCRVYRVHCSAPGMTAVRLVSVH